MHSQYSITVRKSIFIYVSYILQMAHEKPARCLVDLSPRWSTRRRAGSSCATLYYARCSYLTGNTVCLKYI